MQINDPEQSSALGAKSNLVGLSRLELAKKLSDLGLAKFRAGQVWHWIYHKGTTSFSEMTTLSKSVREDLKKNFEISTSRVTVGRSASELQSPY